MFDAVVDVLAHGYELEASIVDGFKPTIDPVVVWNASVIVLEVV